MGSFLGGGGGGCLWLRLGGCARPGSCQHGFGFCQGLKLGGMKITGLGQFAEGFLLGLEIGDLRSGEEVFGMVQIDLLVLGEPAVLLLGLEALDVAKHLGAFSSVMTCPAAAASLEGSMPGGAAAVPGVVVSGIPADEDGVVPGFCGGWLSGAAVGASGPEAAPLWVVDDGMDGPEAGDA